MTKLRQYLQKSAKELKKVHWPDKAKVVETSLIVGGCALVFAIYLWGVDLIISQVFTVIFY